MSILCLQTFQIPFSRCRSQTYIILKGRTTASLNYNVTAQVMVTHSFYLKSVFNDNVIFFSCSTPQGCGAKSNFSENPPQTKKKLLYSFFNYYRTFSQFIQNYCSAADRKNKCEII